MTALYLTCPLNGNGQVPTFLPIAQKGPRVKVCVKHGKVNYLVGFVLIS